MIFPLGIFRFLTIFNLVVLGLFAVMCVVSLPVAGTGAIFAILLLTPALLHNRRCLVLQRHFRQPGLPVNAALPMAINLSSIGAFIWAILILWEVANFFRTDPVMFQPLINSAVNNAPDAEQKAMMRQIAYSTMRAGAIFFGIHGLSIILNCIVSVQYSRRLRAELPEEDSSVDSNDDGSF